MEKITERYTKSNLLFNSQSFYYNSGLKTISVCLVYRNGIVWSSEVKEMVNMDSEYIPNNFTTGLWLVKQEDGNSTKEEFENALKLANLYNTK